MDQAEFRLPHPRTGEPCDCKVWISSRHAAAGGAASISWRADVQIGDQAAKLELGPRIDNLMAGALLLPPDTLARQLVERSLR